MDFDNSTDTISPDLFTYLTIACVGSLGMPAGTTAQRPASPVGGFTRYNQTLTILEYWNGTAWVALGSGWGLTGNAATVAGTNFVGTTDDIDVVLKRFSIQSARLFAASTGNATFGTGSLLVVTGTNNTAIGTTSVALLTTGSNNTTLGFNTGSALTVENKNTLIGSGSGIVLTSSNNTIIGATTVSALTTGANNTIIGANVTNSILGVALPATLADTVLLADGSGNARLQAGADGIVTVAYHKDVSKTFATLPSAVTVGAGTTSFITDAKDPMSGQAVIGSGTVSIPVYSDGTKWIAGAGIVEPLHVFMLMGA